MLLIEINPNATRPETEFNNGTPEAVAARNQTLLAEGKPPTWVVIGVAESPKEARLFVNAYRAARGDAVA